MTGRNNGWNKCWITIARDQDMF